MYQVILGRQPEIGLAELYVTNATVTSLSKHTAQVSTLPDISRLGGALKIAEIITTLPAQSWPAAETAITQTLAELFEPLDNKITLGFSVYDWGSVKHTQLSRLGLRVKKALKDHPASIRLVPQKSTSLSAASVIHNRLGTATHKAEIILTRNHDQSITIARTITVQDIDQYAKRDHGRPKRDAFVGMLPPKLAQIMLNLALVEGSVSAGSPLTILDPFCGTGVILQEALLMGHNAYGTDLSDKMIDYSQANLDWLEKTHKVTPQWRVHQGDAMKTQWELPLDAVVGEVYLGQPFSAPPSPKKLKEVVANCNYIAESFLKNLQPQLKANTPLCLALPAWVGKDNRLTHLPLLSQFTSLGYHKKQSFIYRRPDQVVARELVVLVRS